MLDSKLTVRVSHKMRQRIKALAEQRGSSLTEVVHEAIEGYLEQATDTPITQSAHQGTHEAVASPAQGEPEDISERRRIMALFAKIDGERNAILARRGGELLDDPVTYLDEIRESINDGEYDDNEDTCH